MKVLSPSFEASLRPPASRFGAYKPSSSESPADSSGKLSDDKIFQFLWETQAFERLFKQTFRAMPLGNLRYKLFPTLTNRQILARLLREFKKGDHHQTLEDAAEEFLTNRAGPDDLIDRTVIIKLATAWRTILMR
ncbi:MAG: hypothetical protein IPK79_03865 [Vampirovibrionales bacterium]|nr:hypothetical protein [Vampirovibrionales bacterium]